MSIFSFIRSLFSSKVILVGKSEVSNPTQCVRVRIKQLEPCHINVLKIIGNQNGIRASQLDRVYNSGGRRANDLLHLGYVDNIGNKTTMVYALNDKGIELLNSL